MVDQIEQAGPDGINQAELEQIMLVNGLASVRLTRTYLSCLSTSGRIKKEGRRYFGAELRNKEQEIAGLGHLMDTHTHTHTTQTRS